MPSMHPDDPAIAAMLKERQWHGLQQALREQMVKEGVLPPSILYMDADQDMSATIELELADKFERVFTEAQLGLALNIGDKGRVIVKKCMPDSPSSQRRIPPGCFVTTINGEELGSHRSLKEVQKIMVKAERPIKIEFEQSETSKALAESTHNRASEERAAAQRAKDEFFAQLEEQLKPVPLETEPIFSRTFPDARIGLVLHEHSRTLMKNGARTGVRRTTIKLCAPRSPAWRAGIPPGVFITAINGRSIEFRRFKEVKKLIELAQRPVTISFSMEDEPTFPAAKPKASANAVPAYAVRPV